MASVVFAWPASILLVGSDSVGDRSKSIASLVQCLFGSAGDHSGEFGSGRISVEIYVVFQSCWGAASEPTRLALDAVARSRIVQLTLQHTWQVCGSDNPGPTYQ